MTTSIRKSDDSDKPEAHLNFIEEIITEDLAQGRHQQVVTRFPPEPNGYLHIGHAKSICLNFGLAKKFGGKCHLRMDDTNPTTEDTEYVESIQNDVRWLGFDWGENMFYASDYFGRIYDFAIELIKNNKAYVDSSSEAEIREMRGTINEPGKHSPHRTRSVEENLDLLERMRKGEFPEGAHVVRIKGDMASPNMKMRDWPIIRIKHAHHHRTGDKWCIYPLYDFAHSLSDAIEGISHSICTLEFESNRELYDWIINNVTAPAQPHQYEFARLNITHTVMSKRKLLELVKTGGVRGWDDPRMPTLAGMRRRGVTPEAIRAFCEEIGVAKANSTVEIEKFEHFIRQDLDRKSDRVMVVLDPIKVVIENYPEGQVEEFEAPYHPDGEGQARSRKLPFSREIYIEREDFAEEPPKDWFRLAPGREVRLRYAYVVKNTSVVKDANGKIIELRCSYDAASREGQLADGRKVKGTLHWVSAAQAKDVEVRLYERLFKVERPDLVEEGQDWKATLNPDSLATVTNAKAEPSLLGVSPGTHIQFERKGFFFVDPVDSKTGAPIFNRTVSLKASYTVVKDQNESLVDERKSAKAAPKAAVQTPEDRMARVSAEAKVIAEQLVTNGVGREDAIVLAENATLRAYYEQALAGGGRAKTVANLLVNEIARALEAKGSLSFPPTALGELATLVDDRTLTATLAKDVLAEMMTSGQTPKVIVDAKGLRQVSDESALEPIVDKVLAESAGEVKRYREGNTKLMGFFVGRVMKASGGKANAERVTELLTRKLA